MLPACEIILDTSAGFDVSWEIALLCKMNKTVDNRGRAQNMKWQGVVNFLRIHEKFSFLVKAIFQRNVYTYPFPKFKAKVSKMKKYSAFVTYAKFC